MVTLYLLSSSYSLTTNPRNRETEKQTFSMQQAHQRLLWTQKWLTGVLEIGTPPKVPEDPSDDTQATAHATDFQSPATGTDTSFEIVSHKNDEDASNTVSASSKSPTPHLHGNTPSNRPHRTALVAAGRSLHHFLLHLQNPCHPNNSPKT